MDSKLYLTIASIVAILYALGFLLIPTTLALFFSGMLEPHETLNLRFGGAADLAWGMILWFARDWNREAVRGVLISSAVGLAIIIVVNIRGTVMGLLVVVHGRTRSAVARGSLFSVRRFAQDSVTLLIATTGT